MKRMHYLDLPRTEMAQLKRDYLKVFEKDRTQKDGKFVRGLQSRWEEWLQNNAPASRLPKKFAYFLVADFSRLVDVYDEFKNLHIQKTIISGSDMIDNPVWKDLESIFKYKNGYDEKIANFFIEKAGELKIRTCYYCQTAYVNTYTYQDGTTMVTSRQFDIDHFLPKDDCPCLALSLFNFVPSCQVCNSRIKLVGIPGSCKADYELFSPTSKKANYDDNIQIRLRPRLTAEGRTESYIHIKTNVPYEKYVNFFHLEERYDFHKIEAVRLNRLKKRYPEVKLRSIAKLLHYKPSVVKEDIFHLKYMRQEGRCFEKMTKDILG